MNDAEEIVEQLNVLVEELESYPDSNVRDKALDLVGMVLALHGEVLHRVLKVIDSSSEREQLLSQIIGDDAVRGILVIHGLAPDDLPARVSGAVENLRPSLLLQGSDIKLVAVENDRAVIRLIRNGQGAPPVSVLKSQIETSLTEAVPDLVGVTIEGLAEQMEATAKAAAILASMAARRGGSQTVKPVQIKRTHPVDDHNGKWIPVVRSLGFDESCFKVVSYADIDLLVCKIDGDFFAYRNACAVDSHPLNDAFFESPMLICSCHGHHYDLQRRGSCVEKADLRLGSLPVKIEEDKVKVGV